MTCLAKRSDLNNEQETYRKKVLFLHLFASYTPQVLSQRLEYRSITLDVLKAFFVTKGLLKGGNEDVVIARAGGLLIKQ